MFNKTVIFIIALLATIVFTAPTGLGSIPVRRCFDDCWGCGPCDFGFTGLIPFDFDGFCGSAFDDFFDDNCGGCFNGGCSDFSGCGGCFDGCNGFGSFNNFGWF